MKKRVQELETEMAEKDPEFFLRYIRAEYGAEHVEDYEIGSLDLNGTGWLDIEKDNEWMYGADAAKQAATENKKK